MNKLMLLMGLIIISSPAYAYIDPGTGSFIIQGIIASFVSLTFTLKMYWHRIKKLFVKSKKIVEDNNATV